MYENKYIIKRFNYVISLRQRKTCLRAEEPRNYEYVNYECSRFNRLSEIASLLEIANVNDLVSQVARKFVSDLQVFNNQAAYNFLGQLSGQQYDKDKVADIFSQTIIKCTTLALTDLGKALGEEKGVLFNGLLASNAAKILGGILEFEKKIDEHFPGASEQIIKIAGNGLIALVAIHCPVLGTLLAASGIVNTVSKFLACENLEKTVQDLKNTVDKIEKDKKLSNIYETGMQAGELSEAASVPVTSISNLNLGASALKKLVEVVKENVGAKSFVQSIFEMSALIPSNKDELNKKLTAIKEVFLETVNKQNLPEELKKSINDSVVDKFKDIENGLSKVLSIGTSFFQKVVYQQEAANKILEVGKELTGIINNTTDRASRANDITTKAINLVQNVLQGPIVEFINNSINFQGIAKELGLNNMTRVSLERTASQQSESRKI